jgi:hypothetical protein
MQAKNPIDASAEIFQIKITLLDTKPAVWRRLLVPAGLSLGRLHECIQVSMGWTFSHLHEFLVGDKRYGVPDPEFEDPANRVYQETTVKLSTIAARGIKSFSYTYDFGDGWEHEILIERALPAESGVEYPRFLEGERRCPPENCGGPPGYEAFLEALADPNHPEHDSIMDWYGGDYDPDDIERYIIDIQLGRIAASRRGGIKAKGRPRK